MVESASFSLGPLRPRGARPRRSGPGRVHRVRRRAARHAWRGDALQPARARQAAAADAGVWWRPRPAAAAARRPCPPPAPSRWSTPIRWSTTTCRRWTTTICAAAGRRATRCSAKRLAILAGDALLTLAFEVLARDVRRRPMAAALLLPYLAEAAGATALVGGQADDLAEQRRPHGRAGAARAPRSRSIAARPGPCSWSRCAWAALVAGADAAQLARLERLRPRLGLAFQITDDLLDVRGDAAAIGKRVGKDSRPRQADLSRPAGRRRKRADGPSS